MSPKDRDAYIKLGQEVGRLIREAIVVAPDEPSYSTRRITFPGVDGQPEGVTLMVIRNDKLVDIFHAVAERAFKIQDFRPFVENLFKT